MKPAARQFYRTAIVAFEHAQNHSLARNESDAVQVVLSLDFGIEMLLKAVLLNREESIMSGNRSITLTESLKRSGPYKQASTVEILRERRNNLQHFAQYTDAVTTQDLHEGTLLFVAEVLDRNFGQKLPSSLRMLPLRVPTISGIQQLLPADELQRDVDIYGDVVVWTQGIPNSNSLAVHARLANGDAKRFTPDGEFEYMPKTNGEAVVAYRQFGGIAHYDLTTGIRSIISETGGATDMNADWVAAQGLSIPGGLGGGVWLYNLKKKIWGQVSEGGDSACLTEEYLVWEELEEDGVAVKYRKLEGDGLPQILVRSAKQPSVSGDRVAWVDWQGTKSAVHVSRLDGTEIYSAPGGFFPCLRGDVVAYLVADGDSHSVVIDDVMSGENIMSIPGVGFPIGSGPVLSEDTVYFESKMDRPLHAIFRLRFSY